MTMTKAIGRAWTDADYKAKLLSDPHAALAEVGVAVPTGTTVEVMENTADTHHLVLPVSPAETGELSRPRSSKPPSFAIWTQSMPIQSHSGGPNQPTISWPQSSASVSQTFVSPSTNNKSRELQYPDARFSEI
jgi:hypothetical protein